ncbi:hypothetical protein FRB99_009006 [Tulasnella sp. 403]|nr:hypothetical protein FRB99_009006 [Tulasnella sp. 403]
MNILQRLQNHDPGIDFSYDLQDDTAWNPGTLNRFLLRNEIAARVTALAVEPLLGLLAVGTSSGKILLSGSPPTFVTLEVPKGVERVMGAAASSGVKFLGFATKDQYPSIPLDGDNVLHVWNLDPQREEATSPILLSSLPFPEPVRRGYFVESGALGGGNYSEEELFTERSPPVTTLSVHPSGHIFAVGHMDGCISFWAVEDDDRPLAVRTLSEPFSFLDVHLPDTMSLIDQQSPDSPGKERKEREPIFKLAWSGFPGVQNPGDYGMSSPTTLTILGGTLPTDLSGVSILSFPKLTLPNPDAAAPPSPSAASSISPTTRQALKTSLFPSETLDEHDFEPRSSFPSTTPIEDFVLIPRNNPYLNGSFDTVGIILLSSADGRSKGVLQAFEFPPQVVHSGALDEHRLARVRLPVMLEFAYPCIDDVVMGASIVKFDKREAFGRLLSGWINGGDKGDTFLGKRIQSNGGSAWSDFDGDNAPDPNLSKYDYPRVMVLFHRDLSVRFYDISFLAIGYSDNSLLVVDLRGPRVLFRDLSKDEKDKLGPVNVFNWAICGLGAKPQLSLRLFATHRSGTTRILTFVHDPETQKWDIDPSHHVDGAHSRRDSSSAGPTTIPISSCADPYLSIVLDGKNGQDLTATPSALQKIIDESEADSQSVFSKGSSSTKDTHHKKAHCFWVIVGKKELRCYENIVGNRVGLAEWSKEGGEIVHVKIVNRKGSPVLVAIQTSGKAMIYSLPELEYMRSVDIPSMNPAQESTFDLDPEGDFLQYTTSTPLPSITYGTLFNFRRPLPPHVDFGEPAPPALPAPPQPIPLVPVTVTSGLGAWIWGTAPKVYKGSEIDGILAGLDRPLPRAASPKPSNAKVNSTARRGMRPRP